MVDVSSTSFPPPSVINYAGILIFHSLHSLITRCSDGYFYFNRRTLRHLGLHTFVMLALTQLGLVTPWDLGQHRWRYWFVAERHQATISSNIDLSSFRCSAQITKYIVSRLFMTTLIAKIYLKAFLWSDSIAVSLNLLHKPHICRQ